MPYHYFGSINHHNHFLWLYYYYYYHPSTRMPLQFYLPKCLSRLFHSLPVSATSHPSGLRTEVRIANVRMTNVRKQKYVG